MNAPLQEPKPLAKLVDVGPRRLVLVACVLCLIATLLMIWSIFDPTPLPVMVSMSVGQAVGTLGLVCYIAAVVAYQWKQRREQKARVEG